MRIIAIFFCYFVFLSNHLVVAQNYNLLSVGKEKLIIDNRPKKYFIKNKISRDTLLLSFYKGLSNEFKKEKQSFSFVTLTTENAKNFNKLKFYYKKITVNETERRPKSKYAFFRFFRKKNKKDIVAYLKPQTIISNQVADLSDNPLIIITRFRIDNQSALNFDFRNRTILKADYTIYDKQGIAQKYYRTKLIVNMQEDVKPEVMLHFQQMLGSLCAESILGNIANSIANTAK